MADQKDEDDFPFDDLHARDGFCAFFTSRRPTGILYVLRTKKHFVPSKNYSPHIGEAGMLLRSGYVTPPWPLLDASLQHHLCRNLERRESAPPVLNGHTFSAVKGYGRQMRCDILASTGGCVAVLWGMQMGRSNFEKN